MLVVITCFALPFEPNEFGAHLHGILGLRRIKFISKGNRKMVTSKYILNKNVLDGHLNEYVYLFYSELVACLIVN